MDCFPYGLSKAEHVNSEMNIFIISRYYEILFSGYILPPFLWETQPKVLLHHWAYSFESRYDIP